MKRFSIFVFVFLCFCQLSWGQTAEDKRRIEEEKRQNLAPSESYQVKVKEVPPPDTQSDQGLYLSELLSQKTAALSDAYKVIVLLMGHEERYGDPDACFSFLKREGIIPPGIEETNGHDVLRKGVAAYMFAKTMGMKGGIMMRAFGPSRRYAFKELVYEGIMYPGNIRDIMSGQELILTVMQAADYLAEQQLSHQENKSGRNIFDLIWGGEP